MSKVINYFKKNVIYVVLMVLLIIFAVTGRNFFTWSNLRNVVNQSSYQIVLGVGVVFVMLSGALDLSVGYQMSLGGSVMGILMSVHGMPWGIVVIIGLILGMCMSFVNGFFVAKLKVFAFIVTLATQYIYQGISYMVTNSATFSGFSDSFKMLGQGYIGPIPISIIIMVAVVIFGSFLLNKTYFGRYVFAVGGNPEAASLAGINVDLYRMLVFVISGFFVALGTILLISRAGSASSSMGVGTEFTAIAGGILGGVKVQGGEGKVSSIVVGVLVMNVLTNGMQLMQLGAYPQYVAKGCVLILALAVDSLQTRRIIKQAKLVAGSAPAEDNEPTAANA